MRKCETVKANDLFSMIIEKGVYFKNKYCIIYYLKNDLEIARFGISVGKKIGNAVTRNKLKRQTRAIIDTQKNNYQKGKDYIIMIRKSCLDLSYQEIEKALEDVCKKIK